MPEVTDALLDEVLTGSRRVFRGRRKNATFGQYDTILSTELEIALALEVRRLREELRTQRIWMLKNPGEDPND